MYVKIMSPASCLYKDRYFYMWTVCVNPRTVLTYQFPIRQTMCFSLLHFQSNLCVTDSVGALSSNL